MIRTEYNYLAFTPFMVAALDPYRMFFFLLGSDVYTYIYIFYIYIHRCLIVESSIFPISHCSVASASFFADRNVLKSNFIQGNYPHKYPTQYPTPIYINRTNYDCSDSAICLGHGSHCNLCFILVPDRSKSYVDWLSSHKRGWVFHLIPKVHPIYCL